MCLLFFRYNLSPAAKATTASVPHPPLLLSLISALLPPPLHYHTVAATSTADATTTATTTAHNYGNDYYYGALPSYDISWNVQCRGCWHGFDPVRNNAATCDVIPRAVLCLNAVMLQHDPFSVLFRIHSKAACVPLHRTQTCHSALCVAICTATLIPKTHTTSCRFSSGHASM